MPEGGFRVDYGPMQEARSKFREYFEAFLIAVLFLQFANTYVVETFYIPSRSMENTLLVGDHLFVNRFVFANEGVLSGVPLLPARPVRRGDIVIFRSKQEPPMAIVKRCIGLPGDTIEIVSQRVFINGVALDDAAFTKHTEPALPNRRDNFGPFTVPPNQYFLMGDNREDSLDSRYWGALPAHMVKGRASLIYWSYGGETPTGEWTSLGKRLELFARTVGGFLWKTRWSRTFHLVR